MLNEALYSGTKNHYIFAEVQWNVSTSIELSKSYFRIWNLSPLQLPGIYQRSDKTETWKTTHVVVFAPFLSP